MTRNGKTSREKCQHAIPFQRGNFWKGIYEELFLDIHKNILGPPQIINYPDRGPELGGPDIKGIYFGLGRPTTKTRSLEEFWTGNGIWGTKMTKSWSKMTQNGTPRTKKVFGIQCRFYCTTNGKARICKQDWWSIAGMSFCFVRNPYRTLLQCDFRQNMTWWLTEFIVQLMENHYFA